LIFINLMKIHMKSRLNLAQTEKLFFKAQISEIIH